ncbi:acVLRF1 family peptidyl-tRNA hydrolase [Plantactinospora sp. KBS50]|uniref:acVLRF1 family peptidyl-tRNA hydrolase n=1 Tax=Plantactinospora sp. KBS50 TaxID=2024580 RepID=UPI000BAB0504|nr:acVLRF1 family peptidyl-tRNA hydrolase [Plantactinospora sp. KBS50]ASW55912.1 hypothetical protein CIK06_19625 [Plantactinospora sp. KBS50]
MSRPAAGGGRWVDVDPGRLTRWVANFADRHGGPATVTVAADPAGLLLTAPDGATARLELPPGASAETDHARAADVSAGTDPAGAADVSAGTDRAGAADVSAGTDRAGVGRAAAGADPAGVADLAGFVAAATAPRRLGLLLARKGSVAIGVAEGDRLVTSKVDSRYVQGRTAAGGWSQQRFARRRDNQARAAAGDAVELAARLLLPEADRLAALVGGGDRRAVDTVLADRRLAPLASLRADRFLTVGEPRRAALVEAVAAARAVRILVRDPEPPV